LEIVLTVVAWRKGWGKRALLPAAFSLAVGIVVGIALVSAGHTSPPDGVKVFGFIVDLLMVIVLLVMIAKAKNLPPPAPPGPPSLVP
jgi:purine-cytosine permease-like protein